MGSTAIGLKVSGDNKAKNAGMSDPLAGSPIPCLGVSSVVAWIRRVRGHCARLDFSDTNMSCSGVYSAK
jgi:hypothetical protein